MIWVQFLKSLPRFLIWTFIFCLQMIIYAADKFAWKVLGHGKKTQYIRQGSCQNTGECCKKIGIGLPKSWLKRPWIAQSFRWYMQTIHNFYPLDEEHAKMLLFQCRYLRSDNKCGIYPFRPTICREYPQTTLLGRAEVHRGCGFWFIEREKMGTFEEKMKEVEHRENRRTYLQKIQFPI